MGKLKERPINVVYLVVDKDSNEALNLYENRIDADNRALFLSDTSINHICVVWQIELIPSKQG
jgi:hypothetical protein